MYSICLIKSYFLKIVIHNENVMIYSFGGKFCMFSNDFLPKTSNYTLYFLIHLVLNSENYISVGHNLLNIFYRL